MCCIYKDIYENHFQQKNVNYLSLRDQLSMKTKHTKRIKHTHEIILNNIEYSLTFCKSEKILNLVKKPIETAFWAWCRKFWEQGNHIVFREGRETYRRSNASYTGRRVGRGCSKSRCLFCREILKWLWHLTRDQICLFSSWPGKISYFGEDLPRGHYGCFLLTTADIKDSSWTLFAIKVYWSDCT